MRAWGQGLEFRGLGFRDSRFRVGSFHILGVQGLGFSCDSLGGRGAFLWMLESQEKKKYMEDEMDREVQRVWSQGWCVGFRGLVFRV